MRRWCFFGEAHEGVEVMGDKGMETKEFFDLNSSVLNSFVLIGFVRGPDSSAPPQCQIRLARSVCDAASPIVDTASLVHSLSPMKAHELLKPYLIFLVILCAAAAFADMSPQSNTVRIAAAQAARRVIDYRLKADDALAAVDQENPQAGLASKYAGDVGIADDPDVLFAENFESGDMKKWDQQRGRVVMTQDKPNAGRWCVQMPMERGQNHGGDAIKWFMPGADAVYARFYVKFSPDYQYNHHFVWLGANQRTNKWSAFGKAGLKPNGTYYSTGMEPWFAWGKNSPPGEVNLYTYYLDMEPDRKMDKYCGNAFFPPGPGKGQAAGASRLIPPLNQWQCWEFMIQANTAPDKPDGKQAIWVDGKLVGEFTGLRWRNDTDLKVNCFWLEHYGYDEGDPTKQYWKDSQSVWFDDVVVARRYIGPMNARNQGQ